ncbi:hypothetical protein [Chlorogloeopsis fritschii]|nr:hypothetical protein [Chlorogloeopsis fritschii]
MSRKRYQMMVVSAIARNNKYLWGCDRELSLLLHLALERLV